MCFIFKIHYDQDIQIVKHGGQAFWYGLLGVVLLTAPLWVGDYWLSQLSFVLIYAVAGLGQMVLSGFTGLASIGHAAFLGVAAYVEAVLAARGWPFPVSMALAGALSAAVGVVVGLPALRVKGICLAIATLSFGFIVEEVLARWESVTKGNAGLSVTTPQLFGLDLGSTEAFCFIALALCGLVTLAVLNLLRSATGRAFIAIGDSEVSAQSMGIYLPPTKPWHSHCLLPSSALPARCTPTSCASSHPINSASPSQSTCCWWWAAWAQCTARFWGPFF